MPAQLKEIALGELHFDPENPRLPDRLKGKPEADVLQWLLLEGNLLELMQSIGAQGYFQGEPIMVVARKKALGGGYTVVEGNRRLAALKLLNGTPAPALSGQVEQARATAKHKPTEIPALEFAARTDILTYLGYRHITGINEWNALAKARYLQQLREQHGADHAEAHKALAREIGSKPSHVAKLLTGYALVRKAEELGILKRLKLEADDIPFSLLTTGIGWTEIQEFIGLAGISDVEVSKLKPKEFEEFFHWVFDRSIGHTKLGESRNFPKLARVVANARALNALRRGDSLDAADLLTSGPRDALRSQIVQAHTLIKAAQDSLAYVEEGLEKSDADGADVLRKAAAGLAAAVRQRVQEASEEDAQS